MLKFETIVSQEATVTFLAEAICSKLEQGKPVLWFVAGGSTIPITVEVSKIISKYPHQNLTVTLTDERYGPVNHTDSNWRELKDKGFNLPEATLIPILIGEDREITVINFNKNLEKLLVDEVYKIGIFGIGADGHTAGILPGSEAVNAKDLVFGYTTSTFERVTLTPKAIALIDETVVYATGEDKWPILKRLREDININEQPAQVLKLVPKITIFSDYRTT